MKHLWKRLIASMLTAVMLVSVLPPTALAALADNTPDQNEAILQDTQEVSVDMMQSEKMIFVDGREVSVSFATDKNTAIINQIKQILLSSYIANTVKPQTGDILAICTKQGDN